MISLKSGYNEFKLKYIERTLNEQIETRKRLYNENKEQVSIIENQIRKKRCTHLILLIVLFLIWCVGIFYIKNGESFFMKLVMIIFMFFSVIANIFRDEVDEDEIHITMSRLKYQLKESKRILKHSEIYLEEIERRMKLFKLMLLLKRRLQDMM